ncbi:hypothetical protein LK533_03370 [Sphingomonas sp. PL-96]|uniref:phosphorylase family protein n=1 Tax=Sphingomonas sp. PL-96 TaxID=2887201 RepID=UPI001E405321|nr:hypothetical protein [Sphingomonas sp. PL-96]MCC2975715.1 hypothetical protein [Sphingomonas sp. PL-96]
MTTDKITIVALIALREEFSLFSKVFPFKADHSTAESVRIEHHSNRDDVRLVSILASQMGSQSALLSADAAVQAFNADLVVVVGIAGGISSDLRVGDVCVSNEIIDVLHNAKISDKKGNTAIAFAPDFYSVEADLVASFTFLQVHPSLTGSYQEWRAYTQALAEESGVDGIVRNGGPEVHIGPIACGPVVASDEFREKLQALHRKVAAVETESGGVFGRLKAAKVPAVAIRGISDLADAAKAALEDETEGGARRLAMLAACELLKVQLQSDRFIRVAQQKRYSQSAVEGLLFPASEPARNIVSELEATIRARLVERSPEFRAKPDSYYLPMPRVRRIGFAENVDASEIGDTPLSLIDCFCSEKRIVLRLPRSYPSQSLGWSLAYSLIRQQIGGKVVLPYVLDGDQLIPPQNGLARALPDGMVDADRNQYKLVLIIEEPPFHSKSRLNFIAQQINAVDALVVIITKSEDSVAEADNFFKQNGFQEYQIAPISFTETAFFLEKAFDMTPHEAEAVAIRLDDTFRKFKLDAHPTYFASIQEETIAAIINANKRAELIQFAVTSLLTLVVAADKARPPLSRTTRETFLRRAALAEIKNGARLSELGLLELASQFIEERMFPNSATEFLTPFFDMGILYRSNGVIFFSHPYLESYLIAQALREDAQLAVSVFDPTSPTFNYYAFDLYCELGPDPAVVEAVILFANGVVDHAKVEYAGAHIYDGTEQKLAALSSTKQLRGLTEGLLSRASKMEDDRPDENLRSEKQRILDAKRYVGGEVKNLIQPEPVSLPVEIQQEFTVLDDLARALSLVSTAVGAGSESLSGQTKITLANLVLQIGHHFSNIWTRNRLRFDFGRMRNDLLSDENIWRMVDEFGAEKTQFEAIKNDLQLFIHGFELNAMAEPMGRVLWRVSSAAGVKVLLPVLESITPRTQVEAIIRSSWTIEIDAEKGKESFKKSLGDYSGVPMMRVVLASHLLWRVFWHHYKSVNSRHFVNSARRALRPIGMAPSDSRIEHVKKGADTAS